MLWSFLFFVFFCAIIFRTHFVSFCWFVLLFSLSIFDLFNLLTALCCFVDFFFSFVFRFYFCVIFLHTSVKIISLVFVLIDKITLMRVDLLSSMLFSLWHFFYILFSLYKLYFTLNHIVRLSEREFNTVGLIMCCVESIVLI